MRMAKQILDTYAWRLGLTYTIYHLRQERCRLSATCFKEITSARGYPLS